MQQNILKDSSVTKIYLMYIDNGSRKREEVTLRFMDKKECYFATPMPLRFTKPKKKIPAELHVFTPEGVYKTKVTLIDSTVSMRDVMYEVSIPKTWDFIQLRESTRKEVVLPVEIQFNDGYKMEINTYDLSLGGISYFSKEELPSIYKRVQGVLTLRLPKDTLFNFPTGKMTVETKFIREKSKIDGHLEEFLYVFKFVNVSQADKEILKNFLIKLN